MKVLFIGGSGTISTQVSKLAIKKGIDFLMRFSSDKDAEYIVS